MPGGSGLAVSVLHRVRISATNARCLKRPRTAPKYAGRDKVNPCPLFCSGDDAASHAVVRSGGSDCCVSRLEGAIAAKTVTYGSERLMEGAKLLKCSEFGDAIIANM